MTCARGPSRASSAPPPGPLWWVGLEQYSAPSRAPASAAGARVGWCDCWLSADGGQGSAAASEVLSEVGSRSRRARRRNGRQRGAGRVLWGCFPCCVRGAWRLPSYVYLFPSLRSTASGAISGILDRFRIVAAQRISAGACGCLTYRFAPVRTLERREHHQGGRMSTEEHLCGPHSRAAHQGADRPLPGAARGAVAKLRYQAGA